MPLWPLSKSDKCPRETSRPFAASVTDKPSGARQSSRMISPGCGGLNISILQPPFRLVVIVQIDVGGVLALNVEDQTEISGHPDRPASFTVALELMQPIPRQRHRIG